MYYHIAGQKATVAVKDHDVTIDWSNVFKVSRDVTYSVFAGSEESYGDVINHVTTEASRFQGYSPNKVTSYIVTALTYVITCLSAS